MDNDQRKLIEPMIFDNESIPVERSGLIKAIDFDVRTKSVEEKIYIILYKIYDDNSEEEFNNIWSVSFGRTSAYNDIKYKLESGINIDIHNTRIITETKQTESSTGDRKYYMLPLEECVSLYSFCKSVEEYYSDDTFDIELYNEDGAQESSDTINYSAILSAEDEAYRQMLEESIKNRIGGIGGNFINNNINSQNI